MSSQIFTVRWGILATGGIARTFTKDLLLDPSSRDVVDIKHAVVAAASSSSVSRAKKFLEECGAPSTAKFYGSYEELVKDPNVDVVYVATPHSHHFQNVMLCLMAGKNVLCEKAFTVNAAQTEKLVETAKAKNLFLMEAVWTRYFPLSVKIRSFIQDGKLGNVHRAIVDNSLGIDVENAWPPTHRMINPELAGGALLDLGVYSLTWVFQTLYHTLPPEKRQAPSKIVSMMNLYEKTGADEMTSMILQFPTMAPNGEKGSCQAIAMTNVRVSSDPDARNSAHPAMRIQGTKGELAIDAPAYRPTRFRFIPKVPDESGDDHSNKVEEYDFPIKGQGMYWEADEVARCLRDGKKESDTLPWQESIEIMKVMDEVRKQGGLAYPEKIETTVYPTQL